MDKLPLAESDFLQGTADERADLYVLVAASRAGELFVIGHLALDRLADLNLACQQ